MGRAITARFQADGKVELVGAVDPAGVGSESPGPAIVAALDHLPNDLRADIALDFSTASATRGHLEQCLSRGWDILIGATGFTGEDHAAFAALAEKHSRRVVLVPNFTLGINLLLRFARDAARVFERAEIIELHHDRKADAPSGTALHTAGLIAQSRNPSPPPGPDDPSRGRIAENVPVHAVRLPGLLAHQEVLFGGEGEVLTIRHDITDRSAFLSGIYLAIDRLPRLAPGLVKGLEWAFEPPEPG